MLAHKAWRLDFFIQDRTVTVTDLHTGYRPSALEAGEVETGSVQELELHRTFVARFG